MNAIPSQRVNTLVAMEDETLGIIFIAAFQWAWIICIFLFELCGKCFLAQEYNFLSFGHYYIDDIYMCLNTISPSPPENICRMPSMWQTLCWNQWYIALVHRNLNQRPFSFLINYYYNSFKPLIFSGTFWVKFRARGCYGS